MRSLLLNNWKIIISNRKKIVEWAFNNSPFYNKHYQEYGLELKDLKTVEKWNNLPCITKVMVIEHRDEMDVQSEMQFSEMYNTSGLLVNLLPFIVTSICVN